VRFSQLNFAVGVILGVGFFVGCSDQGGNPVNSNSPPPTSDVSFMNQVVPFFINYGCDGCHGGNGGLDVQTFSQLLRGGIHGPAVVAGKADSSIMVQKLSANPPFGDRMPRGGPFLADSTIQILKAWINQGAKAN
jgi:hypothetical protein